MNLPVIVEADYESIQKIMGDHLSYSYNEWLDLSAKWHREYGQEGNPILDIQINPDQFARFIGQTGRAPDINALLMFTDSAAKGETY